MTRTPAEIAQMTPQEAFEAGSAFGREQLAARMRADEAAAYAAESIDAKAKLDERLASLERAMKLLADSDRDQANGLADHSKRLTRLEGEGRGER